MYCELDLMTSLKDTKLLARVAWRLAADCFVQLIVIATLTMEQELVSALCSEYTIIPSYTPRPPHYQHLLPTAAAAALSYRHLNDVWQWSERRVHSSKKVASICRKLLLPALMDGLLSKDTEKRQAVKSLQTTFRTLSNLAHMSALPVMSM